MFKRAQITPFVILGILLVSAVILLLFFRGQFFFGPVTPENLATKVEPIRDHITRCIEDVAPDYIRRIGLQGGHLALPTGTYRNMKGIPISYLCMDIPGDKRCANRMLVLSEMEQELAKAINEGLSTCINLGGFGRGYDLVTTGRTATTVDIGTDNVVVTVNLPLALRKDEVEITADTFSSNFNFPLGRLSNVAQDIVNIEAEFGDFDQLSYMLAKRGQYIIEKDRPYPDKLYITHTKDNPYVFQFFVQDEPY